MVEQSGLLSALDLDLLRIETSRRPMHWCFLLRLAPGSPRIEPAELRSRVIERATAREAFGITVKSRRFRSPLISTTQVTTSIKVNAIDIDGEADLRHRISQLLATFDAGERLWDVTLLTDRSTGAQNVVMRVHHCLADGVSAAGFAYLFIDGDERQLTAFDRYLTSPRFRLDPVKGPVLRRATRALAGSWLRGARGHRPGIGAVTDSRVVSYFGLPAAAVNQTARAAGATQMEYLLAAVSIELRDLLPTAERRTLVRTMIPVTMDMSLRHTGNAMAFALVNLDLSESSLSGALTHIKREMTGVAQNAPNLVLPTLTQNAGGPWLYKQAVSRAIMELVRPDLDFGLTPLNLRFDSVLGAPVTAVYPLSPLVYTPISVAALLLGDQLTVGINADGGAAAGLGEALAERLQRRLVRGSVEDPTLAVTGSMA